LVYEQAGDGKRAAAVLKSAILGGYSMQEVENAPPLKPLRESPEYRRLIATRTGIDSTNCKLKR
jgi:hypothetical protein